MSADATQYTVWTLTMPFAKDGAPTVGYSGASIRQVVVMEAETFKRLSKEPGLSDVRWLLGTIE